MEKKQQQLPPDEERCCESNGLKGWRCKNLRMSLGASADDARILGRHCEKHYNYNKNRRKKKTSGDGEGSGPDLEKHLLPPDEERCTMTGGGISRSRCKNFRMGYGPDDVHNVPKRRHCEKHYKYFTEYFKNHRKKKRNGDHGEEKKKKVPETEEEDTDTSDIQGGSANIQTKRKEVERSGELDFTDFLIKKKEMENKKLPPDEQRCSQKDGKGWRCKNFRMGLGAAAHDDTVPKSRHCEKHYNYCADANKKKLLKKNSSGNGDTTVAGGSAKIGPKRKHIERTEGSGELKLLTKTVVETRTSKRWKNVKEGDQFVADTSNQPATNVTQSVEKQRDETCFGGREYSRMYDLKTKEELLNMYGNLEEGNVLGCSEERPTQLGLSSGDHLEMNKKPFVNLVSDDDSVENIGESGDSDSSDDTKTSLGTLMDMLAMKYRNRNEDQDIEWNFEADMLSSFEEDPELNMKAVCALYKQHIAELKISTKGLLDYSDALRATTLAKFLTDGACNGDLKKSVKELEKVDSEGVEDCKRLARSYSKQLFSIYRNKKDSFFLPTKTASHGDLTSK